MRGRKPKPTEQQIVSGDPRKHGVNKLRAKLAGEPKASRGLPACPRHLKARARYAWNFWAEELAAMNLDRRPDAMMLEGACVAYEEAIYAYEILQKQGRLIAKRAVDPKTKEIVVLDVKRHPATVIGHKAWIQLRAFCSEFGLSPVSRIRLTIDSAKETEQGLMAMLSQPRQPKQTTVQ
jgi:P27 family predicted phage terminase small subunit